MKRLFLALALFLAPISAFAATISVPPGQPVTLEQNGHAFFDVTNFDTFTFAFTNAALWSGGSILYTTDKTLTKPWEAQHVGTFAVNILDQFDIRKFVFDTTQEFARFFAVCTYGRCGVAVNAEGPAAPPPAPVPLPAAAPLLLAGLGALALIRRRQRAA